jgi:hypothetical protein
VCKKIELILAEPQTPYDTSGKDKATPLKIATIRRYDVFPVKRITTRDGVDEYVEGIRKKLYDALETNDGIQIS